MCTSAHVCVQNKLIAELLRENAPQKDTFFYEIIYAFFLGKTFLCFSWYLSMTLMIFLLQQCYLKKYSAIELLKVYSIHLCQALQFKLSTSSPVHEISCTDPPVCRTVSGHLVNWTFTMGRPVQEHKSTRVPTLCSPNSLVDKSRLN